MFRFHYYCKYDVCGPEMPMTKAKMFYCMCQVRQFRINVIAAMSQESWSVAWIVESISKVPC